MVPKSWPRVETLHLRFAWVAASFDDNFGGKYGFYFLVAANSHHHHAQNAANPHRSHPQERCATFIYWTPTHISPPPIFEICDAQVVKFT